MECPRKERSSKQRSALMANENTLASSPAQETLPWHTTKQSSSITNHAQNLTFQKECQLRINSQMKTATGCKSVSCSMVRWNSNERLIINEIYHVNDVQEKNTDYYFNFYSAFLFCFFVTSLLVSIYLLPMFHLTFSSAVIDSVTFCAFIESVF